MPDGPFTVQPASAILPHPVPAPSRTAPAGSAPSPGRSLLRRLLPVLWGLLGGAGLAGELAAAPRLLELSPDQTGLTFTNRIPEARHLTNQLFLDGSGVSAGDVDGDGLCDVFFAGLHGGSSLWRNLGGWQFTNVTAAAGLELGGLDATGVLLVDLTGDGLPELVLNTHGQGTRVWRNLGGGRFAPFLPPLNPNRGGHTLAAADVDGDGWLDLYVVNYRRQALMDWPNARATFRVVRGRSVVATVDGRPTTEPDLTNRFVVTAQGGLEELGEPDVLYRNLGGTNLVPVPWTDGAFLDAEGRPLAEPPYDWGLAAMFRDLDGDGRPELYVANDFQTPDRLWRNASTPGRIRLRLAPPATQRHTSFFSMGLDFADLNRDGLDDFLVLDMLGRTPRMRLTQVDDTAIGAGAALDPFARPQYGVNTLFLGRRDGTYAEIGALAGLSAADWAWAVAFLDVDLDGWEDVLVTNGQERAARDADVAEELRALRARRRMSDAEVFAERRRFPRYRVPNLAFRNRHDLTFAETGAAWGFAREGVSHGLALADLDNDGDLDVLVNDFGAAAGVYRNESTEPRLAVRLKGRPGNSAGIGARLRVQGGPVEQTQEIIAGGRYLSGDQPVRMFAAGAASRLSVEVDWPSGRKSRVTGVTPNQTLEIAEPENGEPARPAPAKATTAPWFTEELLAAPAEENTPPDEFARQPLQPRRIAPLAPGITLSDLDGDGRDEVLVPGTGGSPLTVHGRSPEGRWARRQEWPATADQTAVLPVPGGWLVAESNWGDGQPSGTAVSWVPQPGAGPAVPLLAAGTNAVGPLAVADMDGDGDLDLFVGGRANLGGYPAPARSWLFRREGDRWVEDAAQDALRSGAGLVSGALWVDLEGDGDADLVTANDWGPVRFLVNEGGRLREQSFPVEVEGRTVPSSALTGWWTSVATGDFDGDGRPDLVAGNWGRNSGYAVFGLPVVAFHGPLGGGGAFECLLAHADPPMVDGQQVPPAALRPLFGLGKLAAGLPWLRERFPTHRALAEASVADLLAGRTNGVAHSEVTWLASAVWLNRGGRWEVHPLPAEAQFAPVFGIGVADFDLDGHTDLFLAQNSFGENFGLPRADAGRGLVLRGRGEGRFDPLDGTESGVRVDLEQRGVAVGDIDGDGRMDAALAVRHGAPRVFLNRHGQPGLRVRLRGPASNPDGVGAWLRIETGGKAGAEQGVTRGSGFCSGDAAVRVFPSPAEGAVVVAQWPGGAVTRVPIPAGAKELEMGPGGLVKSR